MSRFCFEMMLTIGMFTCYALSQGAAHSGAQALPSNKTEAISMADKNKDGELDKKEYETYIVLMKEMLKVSDARGEEIINKSRERIYDKNQDGKLSDDERNAMNEGKRVAKQRKHRPLPGFQSPIGPRPSP